MQQNHYLSPATGQCFKSPPPHWSRWLSFLVLLLATVPSLAQQQFGIGSYADFSRASSSRIDIPNAPYLGYDFTIEAMVYVKDYSAAHSIFYCYNNSYVTELTINTSGVMVFASNNTTYPNTGANIPIQQPTHIAVTVSGNTLKFYINGVQSGATVNNFWGARGTNTSGSWCSIGGSPFSTVYSNLYMDEFRIWKKERSQAEIQGSMNGALSGNENDLVLYYDMENVQNGTNKPILNKVVNPPIPNFSGMLTSTSHPLTSSFGYTGGVQTYVVPAGVTAINVAARGAQGGYSLNGYPGGYGGYVQATLSVTPGETLYLYVGGAGTNVSNYTNANGGYNGGGKGGYDASNFGNNAGSGGGATDIRRGGTALANRILVAGGGGGCSYGNAIGGHGGGLSGANGSISGSTGVLGGGGTQSAGGTSAAVRGATVGSLGVGGDGSTAFSAYGGGGGGGGYYGGGGGASTQNHPTGIGHSGSGGGGSSYVTPIGSSSIVHLQGYNAGSGAVYIGPVPAPAVAAGKLGDGIDFNGQKMDLGYPHWGDQYLGGNYTIEGWAYPEVNTHNGTFYVATNGIGDSVIIGLSHGTTSRPFVRVRINNTVSTIYQTTATLPLNQWSHIAFTTYAGQATLYVNGSAVGTTTLSQPIPALVRNSYLGGSAAILDEVHIWSDLLTPAEIQAAYTATTPLTGNEPNLIGNYDMEDFGNGDTKIMKNNTTHPLFGNHPGSTNNTKFRNIDSTDVPNNGAGLGNAIFMGSNAGYGYTYSAATPMASSSNNLLAPMAWTGGYDNSNYTIEGWIKPKPNANGIIMCMQNPNVSDYPFRIDYTGDGYISASRRVAGVYAGMTYTPVRINDGEWHYVRVHFWGQWNPYGGGNYGFMDIDITIDDGPNIRAVNYANGGSWYNVYSAPPPVSYGINFGVGMEGSAFDEWRIVTYNTGSYISPNVSSLPNTTIGTSTTVYYSFTNDAGGTPFNALLGSAPVDVVGSWHTPLIPSSAQISTTPKTATISWKRLPGTTNYEWKLVSKGAGSAATAIQSGNTTVSNISLSNLLPGRDYDLYVKASYVDSKGMGPWSEAIPFTTQNDWKTALHFDGVNDQIVGPTYAAGVGGSNITVEFWVRPEGANVTGTLISRSASPNTGWAVYMSNGSIVCYQPYNGASTFTAIPANMWSHIAVVYTQSDMYMYLNGRLIGGIRTSNAVPIVATPILLGYNSTLSSSYFKGMLDEVKVWSVARTPAQIQAGMHNQPSATETGLMLYYKFDEASGTVATNSCTNIASPNGNGTLTNFALTGATSNRVQRSPLVTTPTFANPTISGATVGANLIANGTALTTEKGSVLAPTDNPVFATTNAVSTAATGTGLGIYTSNATNLAFGTTYYTRGYILSDDGIGYSPTASGATVCAQPNDPIVSNITGSSVNISWSNSAGYAAYSWRIVPKGTAVTGTAVANGTGSVGSTSVNVTSGLTSLADYDVYLRTTCPSTNTSAWAGPVSFFLPCNSTSLPYAEAFTTTTTGTIPSCWRQLDVNTDNTTWSVNATKQASIVGGGSAMNDWLISAQGLPLTGGLTYKVTFKYNTMGATPEKLKLAWGTSPEEANLTNVIFDETNIVNTTANTITVLIAPTTTGTYYVGWNAYSDANSTGIMIDDILIDYNPCTTPVLTASIGVTNIGGTTATVNWTAIAGVNLYEWKVVYAGGGNTASPVISGTSAVATVNLAGLLPALEYDFYVRANCGDPIVSDWAGPKTFITLPTPIVTATTADNDGYIDLAWSIPVDPCLLNNGTPYVQGVHLQLKDVGTAAILKQESFNNLSTFLGPQQPTFNYTALGEATGYTVGNTTGSTWATTLFNWTIESWVKTSSTAANATILSATNNFVNKLSLSLDGSNVKLAGTNLAGNAVSITFTHTIPQNRWMHLAVTYNAGNKKATLFINGVEQETKTIEGIIPSGTYKSMTSFTDAQMAELRFWNRVRTAAEISTSYLQTSFVGQAQTNLLLHWRWNTNAVQPTDLANGYDGQVNNPSSGGLTTTTYTPTPQYLPITGSFRHWVGPAQTKNYQLNVIEIGSGSTIAVCSNLGATGTTKPYQAVQTVVATDNLLDKITFSWKNKSKMSEGFRILRDNKVIKTLIGTTQLDSVFTYQDVYTDGDTSSLVNGTVYNYCVQAYNTTFNATYAQLCNTGATFNLNFAATDNAFTNKVNLSWASVSSYGYALNVLRDGIIIKTLDKTAISYTDNSPYYGKNHVYGIALVNTNNAIVAADYDNGGVAARGTIAGRVEALEGKYGMPNIKVKLNSLIDTTFTDSVYTNFKGEFAFNNLYYALSGEFVLTASSASVGHIFEENPKSVILSNANYVVNNVVFTDSFTFVLDSTALALANLEATAVATSDKVDLTWTYPYTAGDTTVFNIYRENTLLATLSDLAGSVTSYTDLTGFPNQYYIYKIVGYRLAGNEVVAGIDTAKRQFPAVTKPTNFVITPNTTIGNVALSWANTSTNFEGFNLYRNGTKIADLDQYAISYLDVDGQPSTSITYSIKAKRKFPNLTIESAPTTAAPINFPTLAAPTTFTASATASTNLLRNSVALSWTIPTVIQNLNYNYDGYRIYRKDNTTNVTTLIAQIAKSFPLAYEDKQGIPSRSYTYTIRTYVKLGNNLFESAVTTANPASVNFPAVRALTGTLTASTNTLEGEVSLNWPSSSYALGGRNLDGQIVMKGTDTLAFLPLTANSYRYFTNNTAATTYSVRTYRKLNGITYISAPISNAANTGRPAMGTTTPEFVTNFKASQDLPNHVRLNWKYPDYIYSTFKVYRDNVLIANLSTDYRTFYDDNATQGVTHLYQVEAINGANVGQKVGSWGRLKSLNVIQGLAKANSADYGMPNVEVVASAANFYARTFTDSAGYYKFDNVPQDQGLVVNVKAEGPNCTFITASQNVTIGAAKTYNLDFLNSYTPMPTDTLTPAKPAFVQVASDYAQRQVTVTWNPANTQYDGFEVYRANTLLGSVTKGSEMAMYDTEGYAGILYTYSVRGYVEGEEERMYSDPKAFYLVYPVIDTVVYLTADLFSHANSVNLTWSHRWDNHSYYIVARNGEPIDTILVGEPLHFNDTNGAPGQLYTYTVTAVMDDNGKNYTSLPVSVQITYPGVAEITNLAATTPFDLTTPNVAPCNLTSARTQNAVKLTWEYSGLNDGFKVYRNEEYLGRVAKDTLHYTDITGIPGLDAQYTVRAISTRDSIDFASPGQNVTINFPNLSAPYNVSAIDSVGFTYLRWEYPEDAASGFYLFRGLASAAPTAFDTVVVDSFTNGVYYYADQEGGAGLSYTYYLQTYSKRNNVTYYSDKYQCLAPHIYPKPLAPANCAASDGTYTSYIKVSWQYPVANNMSGFEIFQGGQSVGTVNVGMRNFIHANAPAVGTYTVKASRQIGANKYYSDPSNADGGYKAAAANYLTLGTQTNKRFGRSVSTLGERMVAGAPGFGVSDSGYAKIFSFNFTTLNWTTLQTLSKYEEEFGRSVHVGQQYNGLAEDFRVYVGAPGGNRSYCYDYTAAGVQSTAYASYVATNIASSFTGMSVTGRRAINQYYVGSPKYSNNTGLVYIQSVSNTASPPYIYGAPAGAEFGYSMEIVTPSYISNMADAFLAIGAPGANKVYCYGTEVTSTMPVSSMNSYFSTVATSANDRVGHSVGATTISIVSGQYYPYVIAGAPNHSGTGRAFIARTASAINGASPSSYSFAQSSVVASLVCPDCSAGDQFGWSVDISNSWAAVGAPSQNGGRGAVYLYKKTGDAASNTWTFAKKFDYTASNDSVGASVSITNRMLIIGAPNANNGDGRVYWEMLDGIINDFAASDGTFTDKTVLQWKYLGNTANITGFNVYRDGVKIGAAGTTDSTYEDADGVAGRTYVYEIAATANNADISRVSNEGFRKSNGSITGTVVGVSGGGVAGVSVKAVGYIDGNFYTYSTTSDANGHYAFSNVYYLPDSTVFYTLTADYKDHVFLDNPIGTYLTPPLNFAITQFFDKTSFSIGGKIQREGALTGLDSIQVTPIYVFADNTLQHGTQSWSDSEGKYSVSIDPYKAGLAKIIVKIDSSRTFTDGKTVYYKFKPVGMDTLADIANLARFTQLDFADTTRYAVQLNVLTACSTAVTGGKFKIRAAATDGSFEKTYTTDLNGSVTAMLPPYNYKLSLEGVENLTIPNELVVNYLRYRPEELKLADLDRDTAREVSVATMAELTARTFLYHKPPAISLSSSGSAAILCMPSGNVLHVKQGKNYEFGFRVKETHNGSECMVQTGYLMVENAGATETTPIKVERNVNLFSYQFTAGNPNIVIPYTHTLRVKYYSDKAELLGEKTFAVLVEGSASVPGSDVIVEPTAQGGTVNLPIFVLRDPPGDGSSSTLEAGSSITSTWGAGNSQAGQGGIRVDVNFDFIGSTGAHIESEILSGKATSKEWGWELSVTNNKAISTSDAPDMVGEDADILVGAGFATQYGIVQKLIVQNCSTVVLQNALGLTLNKFETEWVYTIGHIKGLVDLYEKQLSDLEAGTFVLVENGKQVAKATAKSKLETYRNNWKTMLAFHQKETLPHVNFCQQGDSYWNEHISEGLGSAAARVQNIKKLQSDFCKTIGTGTAGTSSWTPNDASKLWDDKTINLYNNAMGGIRQLLDVQNVEAWVWNADANQRSVTDFTTNSTHVLLHGKQAKNVTFSGGTNYSETFESANASSFSKSAEIQLEFEFLFAVTFSQEVTLVAAPSGAGKLQPMIEFENEIGPKGTGSFTWSNSRSVALEKSNLISYTLTDDDPGDQFSVHVIQGMSVQHTPYFQLVGGRSSCPQEPGTIYRDRPNIALIDEATGSTSQSQVQEFVAPEETAVFQAQLASLNVFNEERDVLVGLDPSSNPNGAVVTMGGVQLGVDLVPFTLKPNEPLQFPIMVARGPKEYTYDSLTVTISPDCDDNDLDENDKTIQTSIYMSVHFVSPCSEINILTPDDNWTIHRRNPYDANSRELLPIRIVDYDPENEKLVSARIEYRRKGSIEWTTMDGSELTKEELADHNASNFLPSQVPYYLHIWDITDDYVNFPDGEYEIRAVSECEASGHLYSKTLRGVIDRKTQLLTNPEPADQIWTNGDEISVTFNKNLDCGTIADSNFVVRSLTQANTFLPGLVGCYEHKLIFTPAIPVRYFDGDTLQIVVAGVKSYDGNLLDTVRWDFVVQGKDLYVKNNRFEVSVNQGDSVTVSPVLVNTREDGSTIDYEIDLSGNTAWLSAENATGKALANYPETVNLNIASANLPLGDKIVALAVTGDGFDASDSIYLTVHVLPVAPHWEVNPANYSQSMTVLSNYLLNNNAATKSTDSMDMISVWIDNTIRGVAKLSKVNATEYTAIIQVYGDAADAGEALSFRVWDSSTATEYDAKPVGTGSAAIVNFSNNAMVGGLLSPKMLNVNTASDKVRYIPLNAGWTMFSVNTNNWNKHVNQALASLKHPHTGDLIKTATKTASYTGTTWVGVGATNLDTTNVHRGYQIYLQEADTIRISGANASIRPISLQQGWNLVGMPLQTATPLATALNFTTQPDSVKLKTVAQNPSYSKNMLAFYENNTWFAPNGSDMDKVRPYFAYWMKVNTPTELLYPGYIGTAGPITLRTAVAPFDNYDHATWKVFAPDFEQNMLITATVDYNKTELTDENSLVAAYVGTECRGVGKVTYVPELKKNIVSMFVYTNNADEIVDFRIYDAKNDKYFDNHEPMTFRNDSIVGRYDSPYHFSNVAPDNSFNGSVYPNPFSHKFTVNLKSDKAQTYQIQLLDVAGHVIEKVKIDTESTDISHTIRTDALDLPSGVYILQVKGSLGETRSFKLVHNEE